MSLMVTCHFHRLLASFCVLQKWSKGKVRDKLNNLVLFDKATYDKLYKEVPSYKLITPSVVSERLKVRGSLARAALIELHSKGWCYMNHWDSECFGLGSMWLRFLCLVGSRVTTFLTYCFKVLLLHLFWCSLIRYRISYQFFQDSKKI